MLGMGGQPQGDPRIADINIGMMPRMFRNFGNRIDEINGSGKRGELKSPGDLPALQLPGRTSGETIGKVRRRNYITICHEGANLPSEPRRWQGTFGNEKQLQHGKSAIGSPPEPLPD